MKKLPPSWVAKYGEIPPPEAAGGLADMEMEGPDAPDANLGDPSQLDGTEGEEQDDALADLTVVNVNVDGASGRRTRSSVGV